ncbi:MAG: hypothetical protein ACC651_07440, partial [Candidatus Scalindua sp.]
VDILANAGGVIDPYFEWVQDVQCYFWSENEVDSKLKKLCSAHMKRYMTLLKKIESICALPPWF